MMGERTVLQEALFYSFNLDRHVPMDHMLRSIDRFVELSGVRQQLQPYYSSIGPPSIDPELMIRMLIVGYCFGIRSVRRLCDELHLNLGYRWCCRLSLGAAVPDHSTFSKARHGRFRDADLLREVFETVVRRCMAEGLVGGEGFAMDASIIAADARRQRGVENPDELRPEAIRAVAEYLVVLDDAAFGSAEMLGWLVEERGIEPHIPVFDKSARTDGSLCRADFTYDHAGDTYTCRRGKLLATRGTLVNDGATLIYRAGKFDCDACDLRPRCCPNTPARKVPRSIYEGARDMAREIAKTDAYVVSRRERKKIEMLFAHLKRILKLDPRRLRGPCAARDKFLFAATAQNLRKLARLIPLPQPAIGRGQQRVPPNFVRATSAERLFQHHRWKADATSNVTRNVRITVAASG